MSQNDCTSYTIPALTKYTVSYNANGGSGAPSSQTKYYGKTLTLSSTKPSRTGYTFKGWATSSSGNVSYTSRGSYTTNSSVTLYAVWQAVTYTVKYNANGGTGMARQYGIDHTSNGYMTFIDADDTFNGAFALKAFRNGIEMQNGLYHTCVGVFDEVHEESAPAGEGPILMAHEKDMIWMFGKLYRHSFIDKHNVHFHESSRANEDNGFNTMIRLLCNDSEQINFIPAHVYYQHENLNSITRANDCQYSYGSSERDSFYGYVENMIFAIKEAKKRNSYNGFITMWAVNCMLNIYEYYIECVERAPEHTDNNFQWCKRYYDEVYSDLEDSITEEMLAEQYNEIMRNAYMGDKLTGIIPCMSIFEFLDKMTCENQSETLQETN